MSYTRFSLEMIASTLIVQLGQALSTSASINYSIDSRCGVDLSFFINWVFITLSNHDNLYYHGYNLSENLYLSLFITESFIGLFINGDFIR